MSLYLVLLRTLYYSGDNNDNTLTVPYHEHITIMSHDNSWLWLTMKLLLTLQITVQCKCVVMHIGIPRVSHNFTVDKGHEPLWDMILVINYHNKGNNNNNPSVFWWGNLYRITPALIFTTIIIMILRGAEKAWGRCLCGLLSWPKLLIWVLINRLK